MHNKMKKLIFLFIVLFFGLDVFCQAEKHDTLFWTSVSKDTTVFRVFKRNIAYLEVDINTFTDNDTLTVGMSADKSALIPVTGFPLKITKATYKSIVNGTTRYRVGIKGNYWNAKYIGFRCKYAGSVSTCKPSIHYNP